MAKNTSFVKLQGTLDGLTFYKANGHNYVKTKSGVTGERIKTGKEFKRTRENNSDFAGFTKAAKSFRDAFAGIMPMMRDSLIVSRVTKMMSKILDHGAGDRGERQIDVEGYGFLMNGFEMNRHVPFGSIFFAPNSAPIVSATRDSLQWKIVDFDTDSFVRAPEGATHFKLILAGVS